MERASADRASRGLSPLLLLLAAAAFLLLPVVGVSCNSQASQPFLGAGISSLGGGGSQQQAEACLQARGGRDLLSYSGAALAFGRDPQMETGTLSACAPNRAAAAGSAAQYGIGVQPLVLGVLLAILAGLLATPLSAPRRQMLAAVAAAVAAALLLVGAATARGAIDTRLDSSPGSGALAATGINTTISSYFDVHPAIGLWLACAALGLTVLVNAAAALFLRARPPAPPPASYWSGSRPAPPSGTGPSATAAPGSQPDL
ncbi:MAG: hypothetical protein ACYDAC_10920 [Candidatus Dormibacteria bacterium]